MCATECPCSMVLQNLSIKTHNNKHIWVHVHTFSHYVLVHSIAMAFFFKLVSFHFCFTPAKAFRILCMYILYIYCVKCANLICFGWWCITGTLLLPLFMNQHFSRESFKNVARKIESSPSHKLPDATRIRYKK